MKRLFPTFSWALEMLIDLMGTDLRDLVLLLDPRFWLGVYHAQR
jgi:hypothetical protein